MKNICSNCKTEMGFFSSKTKLEDGWLCHNCIDQCEKVGMYDLENQLSNITYSKLKEIFNNKKNLADKFEKDFQLGEILIVDHTNQLLVIDGVLLEFKNLKSIETKFEYTETTTTNTNSKTKKGIGRSIVGGLLFGGVGALIGGMTAKGKTKSSSQSTTSTYCSSAKIILTLQNYYITKYYINLDPSIDELRTIGCNSVEEYGEILEAELNKLIEENKREVK